MPIDPFVILGISKDSSQSEILEAYKTKRAYYQEHVFDEGDQGAQAARMLGQLDDAYQQAMELSHESATVSGEGESSFESVRDSIRNKDVEGAQRALDEISYRGAEWHYYQSIVFYEKNWLNDSKKQLEMAIQMDPSTTSTLALSTTSKRKSTVRAPMTNKAKRAFTAKPIKRQTAPIPNGTATLPTGFARHVKHFGVRIVVVSVWVATSFVAAKKSLFARDTASDIVFSQVTYDIVRSLFKKRRLPCLPHKYRLFTNSK